MLKTELMADAGLLQPNFDVSDRKNLSKNILIQTSMKREMKPLTVKPDE